MRASTKESYDITIFTETTAVVNHELRVGLELFRANETSRFAA